MTYIARISASLSSALHTHTLLSLKIYPNVDLTPLAPSYKWSSLEKVS